MARLFDSPSEPDIVRFAYGEHLLRPTTPLEEVKRVTGGLFAAYKAARDQGGDFDPEVLDVPEPKVALHRFRRVGEEMEETQEVAESLLPVPRIYILEGCILLYTVEMSVVDRYCPTNGGRKTPMLNDTLLLSIRAKLYFPPRKRARTSIPLPPPPKLVPSPIPQPSLPTPVPETPAKTREPPLEVQDTGPKEDWRPYHYASESLQRERDDCACKLF